MGKKYFTRYENENNSFTKGLILVSPNFGNMYEKAKEIALNYKEHEVCWVYPDQCKWSFKNQFCFCNRETKLIVVCGVKKSNEIGHFLSIITDGLVVKRMFNDVNEFCIKPDILLICDSSSKESILKKMGGSSFDCRFDILDCDVEELENLKREEL